MWRLALVVALAGCGKRADAPAPAPGSGSAASGDASLATTGSSGVEIAATVTLPEVTGAGFVADPPPARITATPAAIVVDGNEVLALEAGTVPASALSDGTVPAVIGGLSAASGGGGPRMIVAVDRSLAYGLLWQLLLTLKPQGVRSYGILARSSGGLVMLPIDLPDTASIGHDSPPSRPPGTQLAKATSRRLGASVEVLDATVSPASSLSGALVKTKVSGAYLAAIKRCVAKTGSSDASPGGAIALAFTIDEAGRAVDPAVTGVPSDVGECISGPMTGWRFPVPRGPDRDGVRVNAKVMLGVAFHELGPRDLVEDEQGAGTPDAGSASGAAAAAASAVTEPESAHVRLVVTVMTSELVVWSLSGLEGTLAKPRKRIPIGATAPRELGATLEDIVKRRWAAGAPRSDANHEVIVMIDPTSSMQTVAEVLGAVRASQAGVELFPRVLLSSGFQ